MGEAQKKPDDVPNPEDTDGLDVNKSLGPEAFRAMLEQNRGEMERVLGKSAAAEALAYVPRSPPKQVPIPDGRTFTQPEDVTLPPAQQPDYDMFRHAMGKEQKAALQAEIARRQQKGRREEEGVITDEE